MALSPEVLTDVKNIQGCRFGQKNKKPKEQQRKKSYTALTIERGQPRSGQTHQCVTFVVVDPELTTRGKRTTLYQETQSLHLQQLTGVAMPAEAIRLYSVRALDSVTFFPAKKILKKNRLFFARARAGAGEGISPEAPCQAPLPNCY